MLKNAIQIVKPKYKYFKLIPNNSVRNQSTYKIARAIASMHRNIFQRIRFEDKRLKFYMYEKVSYFIYIEKSKIEFYFIIPDTQENLIYEKLRDSWTTVTMREVDSLPSFSKNTAFYGLQYEKEDPLSLDVDRRNNELLRSNLNITNVLEEGEKVGIFYNFIPSDRRSWKFVYKNTMDKIKNKAPVDKDKSKASFIFKYSATMLANFFNEVLEAIFIKKDSNQMDLFTTILDKINGVKELSQSTIKKENADILETQIVLMSDSPETSNRKNNIRALSQSYETISGDNRLIGKPIRINFNYDKVRLSAPTIKTSDMECQSFISLAGRKILEEYDMIEKVETQETVVPEELQNGSISIGINTYKGHKQEAFLSTDKEYKNLTLMLIGPTRAGKSTLIQNISHDAVKNNECVFIFDFIKNCELSEEVAELFPPDKVLKIECNDFYNIQGLGYNEVGFDEDPFRQYDNAKKQTTQLMALINGINAEETSLTAKMERYLTSASLIVFISGGSIKDVFDVLQNHDARHRFINKAPQNQSENLSEYVQTLYTLDEYDKDGTVVGTKLNLIAGIIDRLNKLKANTYMELMLKKGTENNFNLVDEIQKPQLICLKMPEDMFSTDEERDIYTTYWITKLWLAVQMRAKQIPDRTKHTKVNLIIDEIYQVNNTEKFLTDKLSRLAKFSLKPIISCHYINQLKHMRGELRSANTSYMLISGCDKNNYREFKEELYPYTEEDLLKLKRYHSLNIIKYSGGYSRFITKLPPPITFK